MGELAQVLRTVSGYGAVEAAMRLRALAEIAEALGTGDLLDLAASYEGQAAPLKTAA